MMEATLVAAAAAARKESLTKNGYVRYCDPAYDSHAIVGPKVFESYNDLEWFGKVTTVL